MHPSVKVKGAYLRIFTVFEENKGALNFSLMIPLVCQIKLIENKMIFSAI